MEYVQLGSPEHHGGGFFRLSSYEYKEDEHLRIQDAIWGECTIGQEDRDEVLLRLMCDPLVRRSMGIEQLTLDEAYATIPNTGKFARFEHIWGSLVFVRKVIESSEELRMLSDREKLILELRTFVSDLGHTAFSHLGDWITQGFGGAEDAHDQELAHMMEASGTSGLLRDFGIDPAEVIFPDVEDWIERGSPDLCVDRVDYGAREAQRWMNQIARTELFCSPDAFTVIDSHLVMTSRQSAEEFFRAFSILPTEHWQEPVHRTQLALLEAMVKRAIVTNDLQADDMWDVRHPRDMLMSVDADFLNSFITSDEFMWSADPLMRRLARDQRDIFVQQRRGQLAGYFQSSDDALRFQFPRPHEPYQWGPHAWRTLENPQILMIPVNSISDVSDFGEVSSAVDFFLPALKPRSIDPFFIEGSKVMRLSEADDRYVGLMQQQADVMRQAYVGRIFMNPRHADMLKKGMVETNRVFDERMQEPRLGVRELGQMLHGSYAYERMNPLTQFKYTY